MIPKCRLDLTYTALVFACSWALCACHSTSPAGSSSSETHFLLRCDGSCPDPLTCICGVCSTSCRDDQACKEFAPRATCHATPNDNCASLGIAEACDLACKGDADCVGLSAAHRCVDGLCRRDASPTSDSGRPVQDAGASTNDAGKSHADAGPNKDDAGVSRKDAGATDSGVACAPSECSDSAQCANGGFCAEVQTTGPCVVKRCCPALGCNPNCPNGVQKDANGCDTCQCASTGPSCGSATCAVGDVCCDHCTGSCTNALSGKLCPDDVNPQHACADAGANACGSATCTSSEVCCDHCMNQCRSKAYVGPDACPDAVDPNRSCADAGATCAGSGESCVSMPCCGSARCCTGQPFPPGTAVCATNSCPISDRNMKADIHPAATDAILERLLALPIAKWHYKFETSDVEHIGPMAQDFKAAFGVGTDDKHIFQIDADGVSFAAIQALSKKLERLERAEAALAHENAEQKRELERLRAALRRAQPPAASTGVRLTN